MRRRHPESIPRPPGPVIRTNPQRLGGYHGFRTHAATNMAQSSTDRGMTTHVLRRAPCRSGARQRRRHARHGIPRWVTSTCILRSRLPRSSLPPYGPLLPSPAWSTRSGRQRAAIAKSARGRSAGNASTPVSATRARAFYTAGAGVAPIAASAARASLRYWWTKAMAMLPSPTAAATRFTGP